MQSLLLFLLVPVCTGLRIASRSQISESQSDDCVIVAHLHLRKCGGTTVRRLFSHPDFVAKYAWQQLGSYCDYRMLKNTNVMKLLKDADFKGKFWHEQHCNPDIGDFNLQVDELRALVEPKGCRVVTTALFRSPVEQAVSEYFDFCSHSTSSVEHQPGEASFHEWATRNPENMFHWMLGKQEEMWQWQNHRVSRFETCEVDDRKLNSCESARKTLDSAVSQIGIVGRVDSVEDFVRFWVRLGDTVGFDPLQLALPFTLDSQRMLDMLSKNAGHAVLKENVTSSGYAYVTSRNPCYSKWYEEKMKTSHGSGIALSRELDKRVITLSSLWKDMVLE